MIHHRLPDPFGRRDCFRAVALGQHRDELLPAPTSDAVDLAQAVPEHRTEFLECLVADEMPERVVEPLEVIEVHEQDAKRVGCGAGLATARDPRCRQSSGGSRAR